MKVLFCLVGSCVAVMTAPPTVQRTVPETGATQVDPDLSQLRIVFDQPMDRSGWTLVEDGLAFPKLEGKPWWDDDRVFVCRWSLAPGKDYALGINSGLSTRFRSVDGEPAEPYALTFRTRGDPLPQTAQPPDSPSRFAADLQVFLAEVDRVYPFFELKGIRQDWEQTKKTLTDGIQDCETETVFLGRVVEAIRCLRDTHMRLNETRVPLPDRPAQFFPGLSFMPATEDRVVIMAAAPGLPQDLAPGTIVTHIDERDARVVLEEQAHRAWSPENPFFVSSPQRARLFAWRIPLIDAEGATHTLRIAAQAGSRAVTLKCNRKVQGWPHTYNLPSTLHHSGRSVLFGQLPSGFGYVYLRQVDNSTEPGLRQAFSSLSDATPGWIIDLRGNSGGGYDRTLIDRIQAMPRPAVVLIDAGCISAGETLARDFRRYAEAHLMGSRSAGSSTSKQRWSFPSGVATVTMSVRSRWRADGRPIEFLGIEPDTIVEAEPDEVSQGLNSEILRAEGYLRGRLGPSDDPVNNR